MMSESHPPRTDSSDPPDIGRRIASARLRRGLSQVLVARRCGLAQSYLSRIETGRIQPTLPTAMRILRALRVPLEEVIGPSVEFEVARECPVSAGRCLLELLRAEGDLVGEDRERYFTVREVKLLREIAQWIRTSPPDRVRALELLMSDLRSATARVPDGDTTEL